MTKADLLSSALDELIAASPDLVAAAVVSADGLPMASALPGNMEEDRLAAMSAALLTLGDRASLGLGRGSLAQVFIEGADGLVILMAAGTHAVLVAVTSRRAKSGLILFEMRKIAEQVGEIIDRPVSAQAATRTVIRAIEEAAGEGGPTASVVRTIEDPWVTREPVLERDS